MHADELTRPDLLESLSELRARASNDHPVVLEIAEASVTDVVAMAGNKAAFTSLGLEFAYDDFGAGQARLVELTDIPPDYLKIDKAMIQGIEAAAPRQEMVAALLRVVRRLGVRVIAEGVETELVAGICQRLGCDLGQGYLFGRPDVAARFAGYLSFAAGRSIVTPARPSSVFRISMPIGSIETQDREGFPGLDCEPVARASEKAGDDRSFRPARRMTDPTWDPARLRT